MSNLRKSYHPLAASINTMGALIEESMRLHKGLLLCLTQQDSFTAQKLRMFRHQTETVGYYAEKLQEELSYEEVCGLVDE